MIKMSPGTMKPKLRAVSALLANYISKRWQKTPMMRIVKQLLIFMITFEKIWLMRIFPIIRLNPNIIPMQNMLGKFYLDNTPKTPQNQSKESQLPPKKQPNHIKLKPIKKLKMKTFRKRGSDGVTNLQEKYTLIADPNKERRSPQTRDMFEYERYLSFGLPSTTGPEAESQNTHNNPVRTSMIPALQN